MSTTCPICAASAMLPLTQFHAVPATGLFCHSAEEQVPQRDLVFEYCPQCCYTAQRATAAMPIDYAAVSRPTARQLPAYAAAIVQHLCAEQSTQLLIEVGCNDGTFLQALSDAGLSNLLGVEPSLSLAEQVRERGYRVEQCPLDQATAASIVARHGAAAMVVCRHTLEHVPQPMAFLKALHALLQPGGLACIEVPSFAPVLEHWHVHELWDEHVSYFLPANLSVALQHAGFVIESLHVEPYREMQNIVVWVRAGEATVAMPVADPQRLLQCAQFDAGWQQIASRLRQRVAASPAPRIGLGASHPQANFFNFAGLSDLVDGLIDDDPGKLHLRLPLQERSVQIYPSSELLSILNGGTVLLTAFGYPDWIRSLRQSVSGQATVLDMPALLELLSSAEECSA